MQKLPEVMLMYSFNMDTDGKQPLSQEKLERAENFSMDGNIRAEAVVHGAEVKAEKAGPGEESMERSKETMASKGKQQRFADSTANIKVVGVGGGGSNAVDRMIEAGIRGVEFVVVNTDSQALLLSQSPVRVRIGDKLTKGLGSGGDPEIGRKAAEESMDELKAVVEDSDMVFITAGIGGGTGTGASPILAKMAKAAGALTIGVVTKPFTFEGSRRRTVAEKGIDQLQEEVDTLIVIPNDRLLQIVDKKASIQSAFMVADDVLRQGIQGISELITVPGLINLDFADVRSIMNEGGAALMSIGRAKGDNRAVEAAEQAIHSHLLDVSIEGARGILFNVTGGEDMSLYEINEAAELIRRTAHQDANIIFGAVINPDMRDEISITVIATGFKRDQNKNKAVIDNQAPTSNQPEYLSLHQDEEENVPSDDLDIPAWLRRSRNVSS